MTDDLARAVVADPPWRYDNAATRNAAVRHYETLSVSEITDLWKTEALDERVADDAHLYLWATNGFLRDAFDIMDAWGFTYKTLLTWCKPQMGMGNYFRVSTEHALFGLRGRLPTMAHDIPTWLMANRTTHSAKPESFLDLVERASPGPYLELFARRRRFGWMTWGNQA